MRRDRIDFETFKKNFIDQPDGYFSVYASLAEDYHGENLRLMQMDMICEWRMSDGKIKFVEVPFDTEEQFAELMGYLRLTAEMLYKAIRERLDKLGYKYSKTKPESEAIPYPPSGLPRLSDEQAEEIHRRAVQYELALFAEAIQAKSRSEP